MCNIGFSEFVNMAANIKVCGLLAYKDVICTPLPTPTVTAPSRDGDQRNILEEVDKPWPTLVEVRSRLHPVELSYAREDNAEPLQEHILMLRDSLYTTPL